MDRETWWIGVLFAVGSACFALGAAPRYVNLVGVAADGITFFVGSIFFTSAAALQYQQATGRWRAWEPRNLDWAAGAIQLAGTLFFNISTFDAMARHLSAHEENRLVWSPDAFGSICFLVASGLAWFAVAHAWCSWRPDERPWLIAGLNLAGSIAFGVSAVASFVVPETDQPRNVTLMNLGTFLGALCFLAGALLLLPRRELSTRGADIARTPSS
jgi:predicted Na+-dependent transporter